MIPGMQNTDVLVVGGGLAGWRAAEAAAKAGAEVAVVANGAGNSPDIHALNVPVGPGDSVELFLSDTLESGRGACDPALAEILCRGAVALADEFPWDRGADGSLDMLQPVGCSVPRCVSIGHRIGAWALAKLRRELADRVRFIRGRVVEIQVDSSTKARDAGEGAAAFTARLEDGETLTAAAVVLATGGWCGRCDFSDNPPELRGDGIEMAKKLGAAVRDMDAVQYEPTVALAPGAVRGIPVITTMLHEGATFRNRDGAEFLPDRHARKADLSKAIFAEIAAGRGVQCPAVGQTDTRRAPGRSDSPKSEPSLEQAEFGVWFDATAVPENVLRGRYADTVRRYAAAGVDITREPMLVAPAPHTSLGGVVIDTRCRVMRPDGSPIPGLFAAGEVTGGIHGLDRIGGNAGTEVLVFGRIAGAEAAGFSGNGKE